MSDGSETQPLSDPVYRYLDIDGDGSGNKTATGNYSSTAETFYIQPPAGHVYKIHRMLVLIEDAAPWRADHYGGLAAALTKGVQVWCRSDTETDVDLTDGIPIKTNAGWARVCYDATQSVYGGSNAFLCVRWTFTRAGMPVLLRGSRGDRLSVELNDNFTGPIDHTFMVQGLRIA